MNEKDEATNEKDEATNEKDEATVTWPRWLRQESGVQGGSAGVGGFGLGGEEVGVRLVGEEGSVGVVG